MEQLFYALFPAISSFIEQNVDFNISRKDLGKAEISQIPRYMGGKKFQFLPGKDSLL